MVIKSIPFQIWEKAVVSWIYFFFAASILSPFLGLIFYVFEIDFDYLFSKSEIKAKVKTTQMETFFEKKEKTPYIPIPNIISSLKFTHYNYRPDCKKDCQNLLCLSLNGLPCYLSIGEKIYLDCKDFEKPSFSREKSPYSITPFAVKDDKLDLTFEVTYNLKNNQLPLQNKQNITLIKSGDLANPLSSCSLQALEELKGASYFSPDTLISLLGGANFLNKKNVSRLCFDKNKETQVLYVKSGDFLCFEKGCWIKKSSIAPFCPLFKVESICSSSLKGTFWNENGFFKQEIEFAISKPKTNSISKFSFDKIYKRNKESVICKIGNKTFVLKQNDWLVKKGDSWSLLVDLEEFNNLINSKIAYDIIIFDQIKSDKENEIFIGYIFDESRSNYKKLEILLKKNDDLR